MESLSLTFFLKVMKNIKVTWHCPTANQMPSNKEVTNQKRPAFTKRKQMTSYQETKSFCQHRFQATCDVCSLRLKQLFPSLFVFEFGKSIF